MQLGMIGLGRMGANLVRRLMRAGHECVAYDVNAEAVRTLAPDDNPATRWLMACAVGSTLAAVCCFGLLVYALSLFR